ncbi:MAG: homoserine kinase [Candidatus Omnitrophica bacterium]|nr:homoserine kinase [Candidatus Omnitrophota bacterium]MCM8777260.1 homoserine kinase [Candidatus Omnitrophota bacterium]
MIKKVYVKVPASIGNMGSGFDCAGLSLKFYNEFNVERTKKTEIVFSKPPEEISSEQAFSLFLKAFSITMKNLGLKTFPVKVRMENNIPFKRGLGSSATVILAGVISGLLFAGRKISKEEILRISLPIEGHIDNLAASLYGGFVIGRQDTLTVVSIMPPENLRVVAFIPERGLSTKIARDILPADVSLSDAVYTLSNTGFLCAAFFLKKLDLLKFGLEDRLHQPYRAKIIPHMKTLLVDRKPELAIGGCLSGAGPSVVFFCKSRNSKKVLLEIKTTVREEKLNGNVVLLYPGGKTSWKVVK